MSQDVVVWRNVLLPVSETFIANHVAGLKHWSPLLCGLSTTPNSHSVRPAYVQGTSLRSRGHRYLARKGLDPELQRLMKRSSTLLVHAHFGPDAATVLRAARRADLPLVVTFHGYDATVHRQYWSKAYRQDFDQLVGYASEIIAVSQFIAQELVGLGVDPGKILVQYNGVRIPPVSQRQARHGILFVGRMVEKKGLGHLLEAISLLPDHERPPLTVIGDGPRRSEWETRARTLRLKVDFRGAQDNSQVHEAMREHAVLCVPSVRAQDGDAEGLPTVVLEAAARELVVLAYDHAGIGEAVLSGVTGQLVPEGDVLALSQELPRMLTDSAALLAMGSAARRRVERMFDIESSSRALELLYDRIVADQP